MKSWINKIIYLSAAAVLLWSCEKDENQAVLDPVSASTLTANKNSLTLAQAQGNDTAVTFTWTAADFGYSAGTNYYLQIGKEGSNFAGASEVFLGNKPGSRSFTVKDINKEALKALPADVTTNAEFRIKATATTLSGGAASTVFSNVVKMPVKTYRDIITYSWPSAINVAGNFQGWDPGSAPQIVSVTNNGVYEGFIDFNNASPEFKFVKGNNWGAGDFGSAGGSNLGNGGGNLSLSGGAGQYYIKADVPSMTWQNTKITTWGLIGSATPGAWGSDQNMTYDPATKLWTITLNLVPGEIKFRANDDWPINFGDGFGATPVRDGKPDFNGANIPITEAGNYTINLDLMTGGNWFYTVKKN